MTAVRAVPLTLGGREWQLRCTLGAMAAVEDRGQTWSSLLERLKETPPSLRVTQLLIWALLQDHDDPPTVAQVGRWVDPANLPEVLEAVGSALRAAFPEKPKEVKSDPPLAPGTGSRSANSPLARSPSRPIPSGV